MLENALASDVCQTKMFAGKNQWIHHHHLLNDGQCMIYLDIFLALDSKRNRNRRKIGETVFFFSRNMQFQFFTFSPFNILILICCNQTTPVLNSQFYLVTTWSLRKRCKSNHQTHPIMHKVYWRCNIAYWYDFVYIYIHFMLYIYIIFNIPNCINLRHSPPCYHCKSVNKCREAKLFALMKCLPSETRQAMFGSSAGIMISWFRIGRHLWSFCKSVEWFDSCWLIVDLFRCFFHFSVVISCKPVDLQCNFSE